MNNNNTTNNITTQQNDVLDENQAAELLDCEPKTVQERARCGDLPGVKFGRSWRFPRSALLEALHQKAMANMVRRVVAPTAVGVKQSARRSPPVLPQM